MFAQETVWSSIINSTFAIYFLAVSLVVVTTIAGGIYANWRKDLALLRHYERAVKASLEADNRKPVTFKAESIQPADRYVADYEKINRLAGILEALAASHNKLDQDMQGQVNALIGAIQHDRARFDQLWNWAGLTGDRMLIHEREIVALKTSLGKLHNPAPDVPPVSLNEQFQPPAVVAPPAPVQPPLTQEEAFALALRLEQEAMDRADAAKAAAAPVATA